jgi:hypothetical protein
VHFDSFDFTCALVGGSQSTSLLNEKSDKIEEVIIQTTTRYKQTIHPSTYDMTHKRPLRPVISMNLLCVSDIEQLNIVKSDIGRVIHTAKSNLKHNADYARQYCSSRSSNHISHHVL